MPTPHMLVGGIVEPGAGAPGAVVAFVAVNFGIKGSRMFKVSGPTSSPSITELSSETTLDLGRFKRELQRELEPTVERIQQLGGAAAIAQPAADWVCQHVRAHLKKEGVDVD